MKQSFIIYGRSGRSIVPRSSTNLNVTQCALSDLIGTWTRVVKIGITSLSMIQCKWNMISEGY